MANPPLVPESLTDAHYAMIGKVANSWNCAHYGVYSIFETVTGAQASWEMFWAMKADATQRDVTYAAAAKFLHEDPDTLADLKEAFKQLAKLGGQRNVAVHTPWGATFTGLENPDPRTWIPEMAPLRRPPLLEENFVSQFHALAEKLNGIAQTLWEIDHKLRQQLASCETDPRPSPLPEPDPSVQRRKTRQGQILIRP